MKAKRSRCICNNMAFDLHAAATAASDTRIFGPGLGQNILRHNLDHITLYCGAQASAELSAAAKNAEKNNAAQADFAVEPSKHAEAPTAKYRGALLHSAYDPLREAQALCQGLDAHEFDSVVVCGAGLGYVPQCIMRRYPGIPVVCVEFDAPLFLSVLHAHPYPWSKNDKHNAAVFLAPEDGAPVAEYLREKGLRNPFFLITPLAKKLFDPARVEALSRELRDYKTRAKINDNTLEKFASLWQRNIIHNCMRHAGRIRSASALQNAFENTSAVLCCAGPSLYEQLDDIVSLSPHALVVAVDTAMPVLTSRGIRPDFICSVDPQYVNALHLQHLHTDGAPKNATENPTKKLAHPPHYLIDSAAAPAIFECADPRSVFFLSKPSIPLAAALYPPELFTADISSGGSVATFAWDMIRFMGITTVFAAGLDLSYPLPAPHSRGCTFEEMAHRASSRVQSAEGAFVRALTEMPPLRVPSNDGGSVATDARLLVYLRWFETMHEKYPAMNTFTLSAKAARMKGIEMIDPRAATKKAQETAQKITAGGADKHSPARRHIWSAIDSLASCGAEDLPQTVAQNARMLHASLARYEALLREAEALSGALSGMLSGTLSGKAAAQYSRAEMNALMRVERALMEEEKARGADAAAVVGFFIQKTIHHAVSKKSNDNNKHAAADAARALYRRARECAQSLRQLLESYL